MGEEYWWKEWSKGIFPEIMGFVNSNFFYLDFGIERDKICFGDYINVNQKLIEKQIAKINAKKQIVSAHYADGIPQGPP